jgi:hypothetical protein
LSSIFCLGFFKAFLPLISILPSFSLIFIFFPFFFLLFYILLFFFLLNVSYLFLSYFLVLPLLFFVLKKNTCFILFFLYIIFSPIFPIYTNVFSFILLSFSWFCKRYWMNNNEQVHASSEKKVYFIKFSKQSLHF